jgi:cytochrome P450
VIAADIYTVNRRPEEYPEPERFRPERFLDRPSGRFTWIPFGGGARGCLGAAFALCEIKVVLSVIARQARLAPVDERDEAFTRRGVGFSPKQGARAVLVERVAGVVPSAAPA